MPEGLWAPPVIYSQSSEHKDRYFKDYPLSFHYVGRGAYVADNQRDMQSNPLVFDGVTLRKGLLHSQLPATTTHACYPQ